MLTISIRLNAGSYGACPWDRAHIEGAIEEIPSVVRILRAIISGAYDLGIAEEEQFKRLLGKLVEELPIYSVPVGMYVAIQKHRKDEDGRDGNLYKNGKLNVEPYYRYRTDAEFKVCWQQLSLDPDEREMLQACLYGLSYLGRSEHSATWRIESEPVNLAKFNAFPDERGTESVMAITSSPAAIESLYLSVGERNASLKAGKLPGSRWVSYKLVGELSDRASSGAGLKNTVDTIVVRIDERSLPVYQAVYWCDLLHKAAIARSCSARAQKIFSDGSVTISPVYLPGSDSFRQIILYRRWGFDLELLKLIGEIEYLRGEQGQVSIFVEQSYRSIPRKQISGSSKWVSQSPFFMPLYVTKKYRGGRVRKTGNRLLPNTDIVRNSSQHQVVKFFLKNCGVEESEICYRSENGRLIACDGDGFEIVSCTTDEWPDWDKWTTRRFSGHQRSYIAPASPEGYRVTIESNLEVKVDRISIGYCKNYGLGVLCRWN